MGLQMGDNGKEVVRPRVALLAEHPHQAFGAFVELCAELLEADGRVDSVAQEDLAGFEVGIQGV